MRVKALCSGVALWAALHQFAAAEVNPAQWLQRLQSAQNTQSYQGAFVYERKGVFSTHQIWREVNTQKKTVERFVQLNGPAHEVVRVNGQVTCMRGAVADALTATDMWPVQTLNVQQLQNWYEIRELGESRVAGRNTIVLLFAPRDQHRYPIELHLDQASAIPLKTLLLNEQGQLLERFQFVQFQAENDSQLPVIEPSVDCQNVAQGVTASELELDVDWAVSWIPPGFTLLNSHYRQSEDSTNKVLSQVYSDGLAHFSVFFENIDNLDVEGGRRQLGPTSVASRKVSSGQQQVMVTVVGEIPLGAAERIALSMHIAQEASHD